MMVSIADYRTRQSGTPHPLKDGPSLDPLGDQFSIDENPAGVRIDPLINAARTRGYKRQAFGLSLSVEQGGWEGGTLDVLIRHPLRLGLGGKT